MNDALKTLADDNFEDFRNENGKVYWWASDLMVMLGYKDFSSFKKVINRAIKACITLGIDQYENFEPIKRTSETEGSLTTDDFKLTRFACYLAVMNGDPKKESVAAAQVYFAEQTRKFELYIQNNEEFDRLIYRDELKEGNKALASAAKESGVVNYANFHNAGYIGLYNMTLTQLSKKRNVQKNKLSDYMGRAELAANLFRVTQTEEKIKNYKIRGQYDLEKTHRDVGKQVRDLIQKNTGVLPENLPLKRKLPEIQGELKKGYRKMLKVDQSKDSK